jgi:class 3 adenylate cyclase
MRAGIAQGTVMVFEGDDYVGRAINLASKLCDQADPGQCVAPEALAGACPAGLAAEPAGSRTVPGFAQPVDLVAIDLGHDEEGRSLRRRALALGNAVRALRRRQTDGE